MAISGIASRLGFARAVLVAVAGAIAPCVLLLSLTDSAAGAGPTCFGKRATILGTPHRDTLHGTAGRDVIVGRGGGDTIEGLGRFDRICGGGGADEIHGGTDGDKINGGPGRDKLFGEQGADDLLGELGDDELFGGADDDDLFGEEGLDGLDGGPGLDHLRGGDRSDELFGGANQDDLVGGPGNDKLAGEEDDDDLFGGPNNDDLNGGIDADGLDSDNCKQGAGSGTVTNCEADLAVDVVGPATAPVGSITFRVDVTNLGPSSVPYTLVLRTDDANLSCSPTLPDGPNSEPVLAAGFSRSRNNTVTCVDEDAPGGQVSVDATVSGPPDPTPGNNHDSAITAVS